MQGEVIFEMKRGSAEALQWGKAASRLRWGGRDTEPRAVGVYIRLSNAEVARLRDKAAELQLSQAELVIRSVDAYCPE